MSLSFFISTSLNHVQAVISPESFLLSSLHTLPMFDVLSLWESVQQPAAARRLLYLIRAVTRFCYSNYVEADE